MARYADKNFLASSTPGLEEKASMFMTNKVSDGSLVSLYSCPNSSLSSLFLEDGATH